MRFLLSKKVRKLRKKLRKIDELKSTVGEVKELTNEQKEKVSSEGIVSEELADIEKRVAELSTK